MAYLMAATATLKAHHVAGSSANAPALALAAQCLAGARSAVEALNARAPAAAADKSADFISVKVLWQSAASRRRRSC